MSRWSKQDQCAMVLGTDAKGKLMSAGDVALEGTRTVAGAPTPPEGARLTWKMRIL